VARVVRRAELAFARAANLAVLVLSDRPVCILAGASRMSPLRFTLLHFPGTVLRVAAAAYAARSSAHLVGPWLSAVEQHIDLVTTLTVAATLAWIAILAYRGRRATTRRQITQPEGTEHHDPPP
jgi:membrane protein DedA with SNARE-associated domain